MSSTYCRVPAIGGMGARGARRMVRCEAGAKQRLASSGAARRPCIVTMRRFALAFATAVSFGEAAKGYSVAPCYRHSTRSASIQVAESAGSVSLHGLFRCRLL